MVRIKSIQFWALTLIMLLAFIFSAYALESFGIQYVSEGGPFVTKIHLYSYMVLALFAISTYYFGFKAYRRILSTMYRPWLFLTVATFYLIIYGLLKQGTSGMAYVVDSLFVPVLLFPVVLSLSMQYKRMLLNFITILILLNAITAVLEYTFKFKIFDPGFDSYLYFRSTAWLGHSLNNALIMSSVAVVLVKYGCVNPLVIVFATALSLLAFGARSAAVVFSLVSVVLLAQQVVLSYRSRGGFGVYEIVFGSLFALVGAIALTYLVVGLDVGSRVFDNLAIDASAQTRIDVFNVFRYLSFDEYIFGASSKVMNDLPYYINNGIVENYLIGWFLQYGLLGIFPLLLAYIYFMLKTFACGDAYIRAMVFVFLIVSLSNNALTTKTPAFLFFLVVLACCSNGICKTDRNNRYGKLWAAR